MCSRTECPGQPRYSHSRSYPALAQFHLPEKVVFVLIAELDRREVRAAQGALSCAHWLSWARGIDTHIAREKARVARALTGLPLLSEALAKGGLG